MRFALLMIASTLSLAAHAAPVKVELAGNPLDRFPFFEYVRAFNTRMSVRVAIDPGRFPAIVGKTCDIFVVKHKTPSAWTANPSLLDVTPGGALRRTFVAGTIQANTVSVTPTLSLDDDAGASLGVPYDVVLDCDRNGVLSDADYIDGLGAQAGFYMVADTTKPGPYAVATTSYNLAMPTATHYSIPAMFRAETIYYPANIGAMNRRLPLVVISHGNGFYPTDYAHIANHLASWGYVVLAHSTDTEAGPITAAATTINHTDAFLDQAETGTVASGALVGKVDSHRIALLGHSRGGEGVVIAYNNLSTGAATPAHFTKDDIKLVDSMAPTDIWWTTGDGNPALTDPLDANYHLWVAAGDMDVMGDPADPRWQSQPIADRAVGFKQVTVIHGAGHTSFADRPGDVPHIDGPCQLTVPEGHAIQLGYLLPLMKHYLEGNVPSLDFLTRQYENFHPRGIGLENPCIIVANEYRNGADTGNFIIDDFQWNLGEGMSSAPGVVTYTVDNLTEGRLDDVTGSFNHDPADPFNGALFGTMVDSSRGVTFDWTNSDRYIQWAIPKTGRNFSKYAVLSFRGAQASRHPNTVAALEDLTFAVELRDANGAKSSINIGAYGGGLEEPYQRGGGWADEMETIRIRVTDFLNNGAPIDLTKIASVRIKVGPSYGSPMGRIVLDDLMLTNDGAP
ncbi:MAG TPA: hypothetical protein VMF52_02285 [Steroidobacteraceae bacterium]|nr:hypothetical protein [Steroidobacteraceae bacterium]